MRRGIYLAGRTGTSLFLIGLAFWLVYLIPSASFNSGSSASGQIAPEMYQGQHVTPLSATLGVHLEAHGNQSFRVVLLGVDYFSFFNWTYAWARDHGGIPYPPGQVYSGQENYTTLEAYINQFPGNVLVDATGTASNPAIKDYTPTADTNATFTLANPTMQPLNMSYTIKYTATVAPQGSTLLISEILMPAGIVLALPWLSGSFAARRTPSQKKSLKT